MLDELQETARARTSGRTAGSVTSPPAVSAAGGPVGWLFPEAFGCSRKHSERGRLREGVCRLDVVEAWRGMVLWGVPGASLKIFKWHTNLQRTSGKATARILSAACTWLAQTFTQRRGRLTLRVRVSSPEQAGCHLRARRTAWTTPASAWPCVRFLPYC